VSDKLDGSGISRVVRFATTDGAFMSKTSRLNKEKAQKAKANPGGGSKSTEGSPRNAGTPSAQKRGENAPDMKGHRQEG
jgi:hypothetical protein